MPCWPNICFAHGGPTPGYVCDVHKERKSMTQQSRKESSLLDILKEVEQRGTDPNGIDGSSVDEAHTAILELVRECVPENDIDRDSDSQWNLGFEYCKKQMLENLEKL